MHTITAVTLWKASQMAYIGHNVFIWRLRGVPWVIEWSKQEVTYQGRHACFSAVFLRRCYASLSYSLFFLSRCLLRCHLCPRGRPFCFADLQPPWATTLLSWPSYHLPYATICRSPYQLPYTTTLHCRPSYQLIWSFSLFRPSFHIS